MIGVPFFKSSGFCKEFGVKPPLCNLFTTQPPDANFSKWERYPIQGEYIQKLTEYYKVQTYRSARNLKYCYNTLYRELERQLEFAESRCGTLKQQLDYIKRLYGCGKSKRLEKQSPTEEGHGDCSEMSYYYSCGDFLRWNNPRREDGDCPNFTKSSSAVQLNSSANSSEKTLMKEREESKKKTLTRSKGLKLKVKKKSARKFKKKRIRVERQTSSNYSNASSQTQMRPPQDPVVELYKNVALNVESESGMEIITRSLANKRSGIFPDTLKQKLKKVNDPDEAKDDLKTKSCGSINTRKEGIFTKEEGMQTDLLMEGSSLSSHNKRIDANDYSVRAESVYTEPVKNYCMPTISSKRKQVDRDIYSSVANISVRNLPFIAARSTAPSHNIGVNIQQVLSIMKKRHPVSENVSNPVETSNNESPILTALINSKKFGNKAADQGPEPCTGVSVESKKKNEAPKSNLSHWRSASEEDKETSPKTIEDSDWNLKVEKLKKVLVFLHEDFTSLSQKYKRLQKKLTKRNITRTDAKDELAEIERELEKKEEEITIVIALYKEVLSLKEEFKKLQEKYDLVACGRNIMMEGLRQSNSAHTQMTSLLRKIQKFQDKLKA